MQRHEGKHLKILVFIMLSIIGKSELKISSILYVSGYIICLIVCLVGGVIGFLNTRGLIGRIESLAFLSVMVAYDFLYIISLRSRGKIENLLTNLKDYDVSCDDIVQKAGEFVNGKILLMICMCVILFIVFLVPFTIVMVSNEDISQLHGNDDTISYWFYCGRNESHRVVEWFCWKVDTKKEYVWKNAVEIVLSSLVYFASIYSILFYCIIMAEFHVHGVIFKGKIATLIAHNERFTRGIAKFKGNEKLRLMEKHAVGMIEELKDVVKYQQFLKFCAKRINEAFKSCNDLLITEYCGVLVITVLMVFFKSENTALLKCVPLCIHMNFSLCLLCYFGQIISDTNEIISNEISKIPWYEQNVPFRKMYLMVLTHNCRPLPAKLYNARVLSLGFLLSIYRSLYSIVNLLLLQFGH